MKKISRFLTLLTLIICISINANPIQLYATTGKTDKATDMEVHFIDVGQGDSTLVKYGDHAMLIDAGDNYKGTKIQLYLKKQGITKLDYLILTHPDADHIGGADVIVTKFPIDHVYMSPYTKTNKTYTELTDAFEYKGLKWSTPKVGAKYTLGNAQFTVIAPNRTYDTPNNSSIGIILQNGDNKFLFTGDAEEEAEGDIVANAVDINADVYHVGHHGSKTASSEDFLKEISPTWAVISCKEGNSYGHPHAATLNQFRAMGVKVFRTDEQGSIIATSDGKKITWNCAPSDTWQSGEPTGSSAKSTNQGSTKTTVIPVVIPKATDTQKATETQETPIVAPTEEKQEPVIAVPPIPAGTNYICNTNTMKFHYPHCSSVGQMSEKNKLPVTCTREDLIGQGYVPCKRCNP